MVEHGRWDDITFKQLKRFWPIIVFVAAGAYAIGTAYANILAKVGDHEKRIANVEKIVVDFMPQLKDDMDELLDNKRSRRH